jgi:hypothetical protein
MAPRSVGARLLQPERRGDQVRIALDREREEHEDEHPYREHNGFEEGDAQDTAWLLRHGAFLLDRITAGIVKQAQCLIRIWRQQTMNSSNDSTKDSTKRMADVQLIRQVRIEPQLQLT